VCMIQTNMNQITNKMLLLSLGLAWFLLTGFLPSTRLPAPQGIEIKTDKAAIVFPQKVTFQSEFQSDSPIQQIVLEYRTEGLHCADVVGKAFPAFEPSKDVSVEWAWSMEKSSSLPPGAHIHWQWRVILANEEETLTQPQEIIWLDSVHAWQAIETPSITLHYYHGGSSFGNRMRDAALKGLQGIQTLTNLEPDGHIDMFLYANYQEMRDAIYDEPQWTGGMAFPDYNILILGIPNGSETWGEGAIAHELMHVVADRYAFSCLANIPTWLNEGLAQTNEGEFTAAAKRQLDDAVQKTQLVPLRSLSGGFPEDSGKADLAYLQSWSVVRFLYQKGGGGAMRNLLSALRDGTAIDEALRQSYGYSVESLDAAWRISIGAPPLQSALGSVPATVTPVPTFALEQFWIPTGEAPVGSVTPTVTLTPDPTSVAGNPSAQTDSLTGFLLLAFCCLLCGGFGLCLVFMIILVARRGSR
jgi:hypothetical protein